MAAVHFTAISRGSHSPLGARNAFFGLFVPILTTRYVRFEVLEVSYMYLRAVFFLRHELWENVPASRHLFFLRRKVWVNKST